MTLNLPVLRITLLGMGKSGKTSIIQSYVNNCTGLYEETNYPVLYYKMVHMKGDEEGGGTTSILIEFEDTYSAERGDGHRNVECFMKLRDENFVFRKGTKIEQAVWGQFDPPVQPSIFEDMQEYKPLSKGRMGFLLCFDVTSLDSWNEALNLYGLLSDLLLRDKEKIKPIIYIVACQIDKDPGSIEMHRVLTQAQIFCSEEGLILWEISAKEYVGIKKMMKSMIQDIRGNQVLWLFDGDNDEVIEKGGTTTKSENKCCVQ
eukprot:GHVL01036087.1.p1 GENE.GHVL01036087.1~~GHVL01036087.1.p1  ORF type:complete len:260 (+),score=45.75 GHVL01036087.1:41-820(+)